MIKTRILCVVLGLTAVANGAREVVAQDPPDLFLDKLSDYQWIGPNTGTWQTPANWQADAAPAPIDPALTLGYPSDPGRLDANEVEILPVIGANFSKALTGDLTVNITGGDVTVASVKLGGTSTAVASSIASASNLLVFENQESNDNVTNPGQPDADPEVFPEPIYGFNQGRALIWSTGTVGGGKQNRIDAGVKLNDDVDVEGNRDLHIYGTIQEGDRMTAAGNPYRPSSISSLLTGGARLYIHGNIQVSAFDEVPDVPEDPASSGTQERAFVINNGRGIQVPVDPQMPPTNPPTRQGVVDISGQFVGDGWINIGAAENVRLPLGSVILRADNVGPTPATPVFSGRIIMDRGNLVLAHNNALGGGSVLTGNPNTAVGFNIISDNDSRVISNQMDITQWQTVRGATGIEGLEGIGDHSIEFSGRIVQSNSRGFINLLPAGKELKISGPQYGLEEQDVDNLDHHRPYTIDGSGRTVITGGIHNRVPEQAEPGRVDFRKRGTGSVIINFNEANANDTASDYQGFTYVDGGNLHFAAANDLPNPDGATGAEILSSSGAVGLDSGLFTAGGALEADGITFLSMLNNSANLNAPNSQNPDLFLRLYGVRDVITLRYDQGGLMLGADEYGQDLNFTGSQAANPLARAANMSLAAHEGGSTYTGTITPATGVAAGSPQPGATNPTGVVVNPDTFKLGGGSGKLTLPNNNQLTNGVNTRHLIVANGGEVEILGTQTYTGTTRIVRTGNGGSLQLEASRDHTDDVAEDDPAVNPATRLSSTLTVANLGNGGVASGIGSSTSDASNLLVQGGTLKYIGGAVSTNRLFTIGTAGGTINASGSGALNFSSAAALAVDVAEDRKGYIVAGLPNVDNNEVVGVPGIQVPGVPEVVPLDTSDLVTGMVIKQTASMFGQPLIVDDDSPLEVTSVGQNLLTIGETDLTADNESSTSPPAPWNGYGGAGEPSLDVGTFQFGPAPARHLTLTGTNTGNNTLNPLVADASDINRAGFDGAAGGKGSVGIRKTGIGKWILTGANSYTGTTLVDEGTLLINGNQTGNGLTTVADGATFGGTGQIGGGLTMLEGSTLTAAFSGGVIDALNVLGNVDLTALGNILSITGVGSGTHTILNYAGTLTGTFETAAGVTVNYGTGSNSFISITVGPTGTLVGDYNGNGVVDAADYTVWRDNLGGNGSTLGSNRDPLNGGVVSMADYNSWKNNFGMTAGSGGLAGAAVPEPGTCLLVGLALIGFGLQRRRS